MLQIHLHVFCIISNIGYRFDSSFELWFSLKASLHETGLVVLEFFSTNFLIISLWWADIFTLDLCEKSRGLGFYLLLTCEDGEAVNLKFVRTILNPIHAEMQSIN